MFLSVHILSFWKKAYLYKSEATQSLKMEMESSFYTLGKLVHPSQGVIQTGVAYQAKIIPPLNKKKKFA